MWHDVKWQQWGLIMFIPHGEGITAEQLRTFTYVVQGCHAHPVARFCIWTTGVWSSALPPVQCCVTYASEAAGLYVCILDSLELMFPRQCGIQSKDCITSSGAASCGSDVVPLWKDLNANSPSVSKTFRFSESLSRYSTYISYSGIHAPAKSIADRRLKKNVRPRGETCLHSATVFCAHTNRETWKALDTMLDSCFTLKHKTDVWLCIWLWQHLKRNRREVKSRHSKPVKAISVLLWPVWCGHGSFEKEWWHRIWQHLNRNLLTVGELIGHRQSSLINPGPQSSDKTD